MTQKPRRIFTDEQKAEAVRIINQSGKSVNQVAKEEVKGGLLLPKAIDYSVYWTRHSLVDRLSSMTTLEQRNQRFLKQQQLESRSQRAASRLE